MSIYYPLSKSGFENILTYKLGAAKIKMTQPLNIKTPKKLIIKKTSPPAASVIFYLKLKNLRSSFPILVLRNTCIAILNPQIVTKIFAIKVLLSKFNLTEFPFVKRMPKAT